MSTRAKQAWIVGGGPEADAYADAIATLPDVALVRRLVRPTQIGVDRDEPTPDFAIVCDPQLRIEPILQLLVRGADLLIDAALVPNPRDADALASVAEAADRTLLSASALSFAPVWERVAGAIAEGAIGTLRALEWRIELKRGGTRIGVSTAELLPAIETFERLAGPLSHLRLAWGAAPTRHARLETRHASDLHAAVSVVASDAGRPGLDVRCHGDRGELWIGDSQCVLRAEGRSEVVSRGIEAPSGHREAIRELLRRRTQPFREDRGAVRLRALTDALLHTEAWIPV